MERKRLGLSLGGGSVRGWAHIGVLSVLQQANVDIDFVSGSSAGSIVGAIYCSGCSPEDIVQIAEKLRWWQIASPILPWRGLVSFARLEKWLISTIGDITFDQLKIPFAAMTTDLSTGEAFAIRSGRLAPAVRASCSVPGIVSPVEIGGRLLGDGSISDTVPVRILRDMGADIVIAVDVFAPEIRPRLGALGMGLNALEILVQNAGGGIKEADCLISPDLAGYTYIRFSKHQQLFLEGAKAAREKLPEIIKRIEGAR
jgi:NTE family protein